MQVFGEIIVRVTRFKLRVLLIIILKNIDNLKKNKNKLSFM